MILGFRASNARVILSTP